MFFNEMKKNNASHINFLGEIITIFYVSRSLTIARNNVAVPIPYSPIKILLFLSSLWSPVVCRWSIDILFLLHNTVLRRTEQDTIC